MDVEAQGEGRERRNAQARRLQTLRIHPGSPKVLPSVRAKIGPLGDLGQPLLFVHEGQRTNGGDEITLEMWLAPAVGGGIGFWVGAFYTFIVLEIGRESTNDLSN